MAKKGRNKQKKKKNKMKKNYNKKEFCEVFCQTCIICTHPQPDLCYTGLYKHEPKAFVKNVFNNLVDIHSTYEAMGKSTKSMSVEQFQNVICKTGICFNGDEQAAFQCDKLIECYREFMRQMGIGNATIIHEVDTSKLIEFKNKSRKLFVSYGNQKKKAKRNRYVCASYPSFFSSDNEKFQAAIRKILYGNNDQQQDKNKELSTSDTGSADRHTEGGESKVQRGDSKGTLDWKP